MKLAFKLLWRDWRSGQLNILLFSLVLAVATITAISLFTSRLKNSIGDEASEFFAGDARVQSTVPISLSWELKAESFALEKSTATSFRAMAFSDSGMQLTAVKGVSSEYPLRGALEVSDKPFGTAVETTLGPTGNEVWLASRLFSALNIEIGDEITVGNGRFIVRKAIIREPDDTQSFFGVAPRALIHKDQIATTNAVQPGSRVNYTLMLAGDDKNIIQFKEWLKPQLGEHARWIDAETSNQSIGDALTRAEKFLLLAGSLSVVLTGVAIALAARRYAGIHVAQVALLKTLGQTPKAITRFYTIQILVIGFVCIFLGVILGQLLHIGIIQSLGELMPKNLSAPSDSAYYTGVVSGMVSLIAFAAPPLLALRSIPPIKVLQSISGGEVIHKGWAFIIGFVAIASLVLWFSEDIELTLIILSGTSVSLAGVSLLGWLLIKLSKSVSANLAPAWRLGLSNLHRHQAFNVVQIMIFATLLMLMFILLLVRTSLIDQWRDTVPEKAPNHFVFNIFNHELEDVKALVEESNIAAQPFYPMLRGRVLSVNGVKVKELISDVESSMDYQRELNLTWASDMGADNKVVEGTWHGSTENSTNKLLVSAEQEYAKGLKIKIGDTVNYSVAGSTFEAEVSSIRTVDWDSMNPNFFMIFNQPVLEGTATNWLTSIYLAADEKLFVNKLAGKFPTVSIVEVDQMISQVRRIISQITQAIEFILVLVLAAGTLVFITSIQATLDIRFQESAILRTLGAKRALVRNQLLIEFCTLGGLSGLLAASGTEATMFLLQTRVFELGFSVHWLMWFSALPLGIVLVGTVGWLSSRSVTHTPPLLILRNLSR